MVRDSSHCRDYRGRCIHGRGGGGAAGSFPVPGRPVDTSVGPAVRTDFGVELEAFVLGVPLYFYRMELCWEIYVRLLHPAERVTTACPTFATVSLYSALWACPSPGGRLPLHRR